MKKHFIFMLFAASILMSCGEKKQQTTQQPAPMVSVEQVVTHNIDIIKKYPADILGKVFVSIKPQVFGYVEKLVAKEGATVKKGDVILKISEDNYREAVLAADAAVDVAKANIANAKLNVEKTQSLFDNKIVSEFDLKNAKNMLLLNEAQLKQAEAQLGQAKVNLDFTNVISPTNGVIGIINYYEGSLLSSSNTSPITTVSDMNTMYVYFAMSEVDLLNISQKTSAATIESNFSAPKLLMANNKEYPLKGDLDVISGVVERNTGTVTLRASFENNGMLRGGSNGYIMLPVELNDVILVPQSMTKSIQTKMSVYVVNDENKIETRFIEIMNESYGDYYVVTNGLSVGDKLVVDNVIKLAPGMDVQIKEEPIKAN